MVLDVCRLSPELFWDVELNKVDPDRHERWLVERVLQRGRWTDWLILRDYLGQERLRALRASLRLDERSAHFLEIYCGKNFPSRGIKVDLLHHPYPFIAEPDVSRSLPLVPLPDMAAMKVNAVTNRGSKKDFSDLLLLHENGIPLSRALDFFCRKYGESGRFLAIRSLNWFKDTDDEPDPRYMNGWTWEFVRERMAELAEKFVV